MEVVMALGTALFLIFIIWLAVVSPGFRAVAGAMLVLGTIAVIAIAASHH